MRILWLLSYGYGHFRRRSRKAVGYKQKYYDLFLGVAEKSTTVTYKWATETIAKMQKAPSYDGDPSSYAKSIGDFVSEQADVATENLAAYAEIAKKAQMDSLSLFLSTAKEVQTEAAAAVKKLQMMFLQQRKKRLIDFILVRL